MKPRKNAATDPLTSVLNFAARFLFAKRSPVLRLLAVVAIGIFGILVLLAGVTIAVICLFPHESTRLMVFSLIFGGTAGGGFLAGRWWSAHLRSRSGQSPDPGSGEPDGSDGS